MGTQIRTDARVVLVKPEVTYGTDVIPTAAANAVRLMNVTESMFEGDVVSVDELGLGMGQAAKDLVGRYGTLEFDFELAGSGTPGVAPAYGPILRASSLAETITEDTSVAYSTINAGQEAASFYYWSGPNQTKFTGGRGDLSLTFDHQKKAKGHAKLYGLFNAEGNVAFPTPTLTAWKRALYCTNANVTYTLDGTPVNANILTFNAGNQVAYLERMGRQEIVLSDRQPAFQTTIEDIAIATKNWRALVNGASAALSYQLGNDAGAIVLLTAGACQLQPLKADADGIDTMLSMNWNVLRGAPDWSLVIK